MFPDWFCPVQPDWPPGVVQTDFPLWNEGSARPLPEALSSFLAAGPPPVVFTPGTANVHGRSFFKAALDACRQMNRRAVFLTQHPGQLPQPLPPSVHVEHYAPLDRLLPQAAAFVHHGGIGSTSQALLAGRPQLLMPLAHDQFDNAVRVRRLGVGGSLPATRFNSRSLQTALEPLLESTALAAACRQVALKLSARNGIPRSADVLLQMASASAAIAPQAANR
jgi:UDP:flavonoid glycosyltransferase YjiC (YdhE family)